MKNILLGASVMVYVALSVRAETAVEAARRIIEKSGVRQGFVVLIDDNPADPLCCALHDNAGMTVQVLVRDPGG